MPPRVQPGRQKRGIDDHYHKQRVVEKKLYEMVVDSNHWKSFAHERLRTPPDMPGSLTFYYSPNKNQHVTLTKQLTAEKAVEKLDANNIPVVKWEGSGRANHYLDCTYLASAAAHMAGVRLLGEAKTNAGAGVWHPPNRRR